MEATTKEQQGPRLLDKILPPRLEDAGLEDCALPPDSIKEAFLKAASAVKSRATSLLHEQEDDGLPNSPGHCVDDPWPAAKDVSDTLVGPSTCPETPGPCGVVKGGGVVEEGKDKVVVIGAVEEEEDGATDCVEGLKGLDLEEKKEKDGSKEEEKEKRPILVEGFL